MSSERKRWSLETTEKAGVYYGHDHIPLRSERSGGAYIKFQDLADQFPNVTRNSKILYLVSSALPDFPEIMVRSAKRNGVVFVLNQNGVAYNGWHGPGWEKKNRPMRWLLHNADYVVYQSEFCKIGADRFLGEARSPWQILYNPVNTEIFVPSAEKPRGANVLLAGSHQHFYRVRTAIEAIRLLAEKVPEATLTIAGRYAWRTTEAECLEETRAFAAKNNCLDRVLFSGAYTQEEAVSLFQRHHLLLHTKYNDPCPRLVVEAMACGLPVVFSASGGVPELVGDNAGIGIPSTLDWEKDHPPDPSELAQAMSHVFEKIDKLSKSARERAVVCFDVKPWRESHARIFKQLSEERSAGLH